MLWGRMFRTTRKTSSADPARAALARHLAVRGPTAGDELADATGLTLTRFWELINHPWFSLTGKGYVLSDEGRADGLR